MCERFKGILRDFPHHQQLNVVVAHTFAESLDPNTKILLDSMVSGQALKKTYVEIYTLINYNVKDNLEWHGETSQGMVRSPQV